jgi:2-methylaconitate cis-trans-isomerase PrpF
VKVYAEKDKVPEEFSDFDATLIKIMGSAMAYQIYTIEGQSVNITVFDAQNEDILKTVSYPVVLE